MTRAAALIEVALVLTASWSLHAWARVAGLGVPLASGTIVVTIALSTFLLHRRGSSWRALGFARPERISRAAAWTAALFIADMLVPALVTGPLANALDLAPQNLSKFAGLKGDTGQYLVMLLPVSWGTAAFGEELLYRGFVSRRLADAFGGTGVAVVLALLGQAGLFALGHAYLGPRGMLNAAALALLAGVAYLGAGRNLWPAIVAHGLVDSVGMTALYLGAAHEG